MKFVHIADLHLGKMIHQYSLLDIQKQLLDELLQVMQERKVNTLVIAGDVYDRLIPSQEAVNVLDDFLTRAILKHHIRVLMISGNHDSSDRLHFSSQLLKESGLYIETHLNNEMSFVEIDDVRFYLLPFIKPTHVKNLYQVDELKSYQDALSLYLSHQTIDKSYKNILVTHQFVGSSSITSESEQPLSVGGSEIIDASLFDDFDYVALGHLHAPQKVSRETIRYSGSLMRYSFDEVKQNKSIVIVDTDDFSLEFITLQPCFDLKKYQGTFNELMDPQTIDNKEDLLSFELTDHQLIPHAIDQLRVLYPNLLQITYLQNNTQPITQQTIQQIESMSTKDLFIHFYTEMKNEDLTDKQINMLDELLEEVGENHENS